MKQPRPPDILRKSHAHSPQPDNRSCADLAEAYFEFADHTLGRCNAETCPYCNQQRNYDFS